MIAKVWSGAIVGLDAVPIEVEVDIASQGLPSFTIVGLPDKAVEESKERVRSALKNSGANFPAKRITVNLAPADLPKEGPSYDLPIAVGILVASGQLGANLSDSLFSGELSLDGKLRRVNGTLPQTLMARERHIKNFFLPNDNSGEAAVIAGVNVFPVKNLTNLFFHLSGQKLIPAHPLVEISSSKRLSDFDMRDILGQEQGKRALEIAAAGSHNILLSGPPGAGKTLLARTLPSILPDMTFSEMLEVTKIYSISSLLNGEAIKSVRPFRSPHHSTSHVGLIGGGAYPKPGEISLAHRGVLFLDELPEFPRSVIEALRQPLEDGIVSISRAQGRVTFPARCMLVAAQNPCPCGYLGDNTHNCVCSAISIARYQKKISGPLLDRIDIHLTVPAVKTDKLTNDPKLASNEDSETIRKRVQTARNIQIKRFAGTSLSSNSGMTNKDIKFFCELSTECLGFLRTAVDNLKLSARSYHRIIKLGRTIADLEGVEKIGITHLAEALQYRPRQENVRI